MRRDTFLKSLAALSVAGALPMRAYAASNIKMMIPANPGGGWDGTGRELGKASLWSDIYALNRAVLGENLTRLEPGTTLQLPPASAQADGSR